PRTCCSNASSRAPSPPPRPGWPAPAAGAPMADLAPDLAPQPPPAELHGVHKRVAHDSARKPVTGTAVYVDDIPEPAGTLQVVPIGSERVHARLTRLDLTRVRQAPGIVAVLSAADIPGRNDVSPIGAGDDPVFAADRVVFRGQVIFAVVAESIALA